MNSSSSRSQSSGQDELRSAWDKLHSQTRDTVVYTGIFTVFAVAAYPVRVLHHRQRVGQTVRDLIREEGWGVFYRGSGRVLGGIFAYGTALALAFEYMSRSRAKKE